MANGVEGDLRTGLPAQMIEVHEPARLLMVVEQTTAIVDRAIAQLGSLREWLDNEWIRFVVCDPMTRALFLYGRDKWQSVEAVSVNPPQAKRSETILVGQSRTIAVHAVERR